MTETASSADVELLQGRLDADPTDQTLRLVLADALDEAGSDLSSGYRALARWDRVPDMGYTLPYVDCSNDWVNSGRPALDGRGPDRSWLPSDWWGSDWRVAVREDLLGMTRRQAEDWAAARFLRLPPKRQAELLAGPPEPKET